MGSNVQETCGESGQGEASHHLWRYECRFDLIKLGIFMNMLKVAHQEIDLKNPKTNKKNAGFTQEERDGFTELLSAGFVDSYR